MRDSIVQDLRFALRSLRKQPGITAIAVACLALGIGANTAIFSVVRAVLLASLPFEAPARLVSLHETIDYQGTRGATSVSAPDYLDWRAQNTVFTELAAYRGTSAATIRANHAINGGDERPERVRAVRTTASLFTVLGTPAYAGRTFLPDEDQPGKPPVAVLGYGFWRRRFGGDRAIVGQAISLDNTPVTVVGIMPGNFDYPVDASHTDLWITGPHVAWSQREETRRGSHFLRVVGRLKPGEDSASVTTQMSALFARIAQDHPELAGAGFELHTVNSEVIGSVRTPLLLLLGAVGLVLLIACANVANLLLARASGRTREVAVRTALGADRRRLIQQFLLESVVLAVVGGTLGLLVARAGLHAILVYAADTLPRVDAVRLSPAVLAFALATSVATGVLFGIMPALRATQVDLRGDLSESATRTGTGRRQQRTLSGLIVAEISLSVVLLVGAGLLVRGFLAILNTDPGLQPDHVLTFHIAAPERTMPDSERYARFYGPLLERLRALPGVRRVGTTTMVPIHETGTFNPFIIVGRPRPAHPSEEFIEYRVVSSDYFRTLGIPLVSGREFTDQDGPDAPPVVIINDRLAARYFPNEDPLGRQVLPSTDKPATIVGVVRSVRQAGLDQEPVPEFYVAAAQTPQQLTETGYVISTQMPPDALAPSVRTAVRDLAPAQPIYEMQTMDDVISDSLRSRKLMLSLLATFAGLAIVLSAAGVYGVMSCGVSQRAREIGIRMAMGARTGDVAAMILRDAGILAFAGVLIGLAVAWAVSRLLTGILYGVGVHDAVTFVAVPLLLGAVALLASIVPAWRAARVDPLSAIRAE